MNTLTAKELANAFSAIVRETFSADQLADVRAKNALPENSSFCATHDYFDANVLMLAAYTRCTGIAEDDIELGDNIELFNAAWDMSKASKFLDAMKNDVMTGRALPSQYQEQVRIALIEKQITKQEHDERVAAIPFCPALVR